MICIAHRINTIQELKAVPVDEGVEVDLRDYGDRLILHHDPYQEGEDFRAFMTHYRHRFLILNIKSEGIELDALQIMQKRNVKEYFFLDVSFPALVKLNRNSVSKVAIRFSEYEPVENCLAMKGRVDWVWIDCFNKLPLTPSIYKKLKRHFRLCLVSPELQKHDISEIRDYRRKLAKMPLDAVCSDRTDLWKNP